MTAENRKIVLFLVVSFEMVSLTSISIDRFLMVAYPIKHCILMKGMVIFLWLAVIWIFGCSALRGGGGGGVQMGCALTTLVYWQMWRA